MAFIWLSIAFPIVSGLYLLVRREFSHRKGLLYTAGVCFMAAAGLAALALWRGKGVSCRLLQLTETLTLELRIDGVGILFAGMAAIVFLCTGIFSFVYMEHEEHEKRYYGFFLIAQGVLYALCFAGNLITFYLFFEILTMFSVPLVLHNQKHESVMAGLKYLFYSLCGAYMVLFGLYVVNRYGETLRFTEGGVLAADAANHTGILLFAALLMVLGFGVKAGMFPLHAWLPTAHPVAPAPASAVLSAVIVKAGVLGLLRVVYYIFGTAFLRGSWVQRAWLALSLLTVFMGSMLAYREDVLKKRLAYSTVSQVSYCLFGLAVMNIEGVTGSLLQVLSHGFVKAALFLCTGAIIMRTGKTRVSELRGIGKEMPTLMWCYTIASMGLIGLPPTGGFISKWYLAMGGLSCGDKVFFLLGPAVLLVSALLTAGYLLPPAIAGFFPGADYDDKVWKKHEPPALMNVPVLILTVLSVLMGILPNVLTNRMAEWITGLVTF
ncbi:MAG: proton-conducting membrane transporter [Lachnospiraceae bacterium]|nr:proton-conducting membrane transporter [Lachnospiraceae bacterium]